MAVCNKGILELYLPPTHKPYLPLLPSHKASPPLGRHQLLLLGEQRHTGVRDLPRVFMPRARPRLESTTSWSQVRYSTDSATTPPQSGRTVRRGEKVIDTIFKKPDWSLCRMPDDRPLKTLMTGMVGGQLRPGRLARGCTDDITVL